MATPAQIKAFLNDPTTGALVYKRDWAGSCQALMYQLCKKFGTAPVIYQSAALARAASKIVGTNPALALPGDFHHFDLNVADHISLSLGGSLGLMGSGYCPSNFALHAGTMTVEDYCKATGAKYLGFSRTDGANDLPLEVPMTNTRTVKATDAKRRTTPTIPPTVAPSNVVVGNELPANSTQTVKGYRTDLDPMKLIPWFNVGDLYSRADTFTNSSIAGLPNLDPVVTPPPTTTPPPSQAATIEDVTKLISEAKAEILAALPKPAPVQLATGEAEKIAAAVDALQKTAGH